MCKTISNIAFSAHHESQHAKQHPGSGEVPRTAVFVILLRMAGFSLDLISVTSQEIKRQRRDRTAG